MDAGVQRVRVRARLRGGVPLRQVMQHEQELRQELHLPAVCAGLVQPVGPRLTTAPSGGSTPFYALFLASVTVLMRRV